MEVSAPFVEELTRRLDGASDVSLRDAQSDFPELIRPFIPPRFAVEVRPSSRIRALDDGLRIDISLAFWPQDERRSAGTQCVAGRTIDTTERYASHDYLTVGEDLQGQGVGRSVVRSAVGLYRDLGLEHVELVAVDIGRYVWAMCGFNPDEDTVRDVLADAQHTAGALGYEVEGLEDLTWLYDLYYELDAYVTGRELAELADLKLPGLLADDLDVRVRLGKALLLCGRVDAWHGKLDIGEGPQLDQLLEYTGDDGGYDPEGAGTEAA